MIDQVKRPEQVPMSGNVILIEDDDESVKEEESEKGQPLWCLVGNIVQERPSGEGGTEIKQGTRHFQPGAKVYCFPAQWGDGYRNIMVIGHHRGSHGLRTMVISSKCVTNWRAKLVYNPEVLRRLRAASPLHSRDTKANLWESKKEIEEYIKFLAVQKEK